MLLDDLREKARCYYGGVTAAAMLKTCLTDGTAAMVWYRLAQWARRWRLEPLAMICGKLSAVFCGCVIGRGAEFGPGFVLLHSNGVVVNGRVRGGARVKIQH
ncbi:MAG: serine O-acetyltransferase, partial [Planctomycetaceae bacterium]